MRHTTGEEQKRRKLRNEARKRKERTLQQVEEERRRNRQCIQIRRTRKSDEPATSSRRTLEIQPSATSQATGASFSVSCSIFDFPRVLDTTTNAHEIVAIVSTFLPHLLSSP